MAEPRLLTPEELQSLLDFMDSEMRNPDVTSTTSASRQVADPALSQGTGNGTTKSGPDSGPTSQT